MSREQVYDARVLQRADAAVNAAIDDVLRLRGRGGVIGMAPAGAGKSFAIGSAVLTARRERLRVAVATPTNEQAFALVGSLARRVVGEKVVFVPASSVELPPEHRHTNAVEKEAKAVGGDGIVVGTLDKLGDAFARGSLGAFDVLFIDEAFQANAVQYYKVGGIAPRHLLMGDRGQLPPFSTAGGADRWRGLDEDPLLTAVEVLQRNHPASRVHMLPVTRRLDPRAVPVARAFYPSAHRFDAAVLPGVRELRLMKVARPSLVDRTLDRAASDGWAHLELEDSAVISADPETVEIVVSLAARLLGRGATVRCEDSATPRPLRPEDIAIVTSHNDQKDAVRAAVAAAGLGDVVVNTANKLQGLTFEVVIAWHPLAGLADTDSFHLDPGRLCVMLTRHRHACVVIGRRGDRSLVEGIPPATPAYVGWESNPALDGWYVHEAVFRSLRPFRVGA